MVRSKRFLPALERSKIHLLGLGQLALVSEKLAEIVKSLIYSVYILLTIYYKYVLSYCMLKKSLLYEAVLWRNLASYLHGEGRQNATDASFYWKPCKLIYGLDSRTRCPLWLRCRLLKSKSRRCYGTIIKASKVAERGTALHRLLFALLRGCREAGSSGRNPPAQPQTSQPYVWHPQILLKYY